MFDNNLNPINGAYNGYGQPYNQLAVDEIKRAPLARMAFQGPGGARGEPRTVLRPAPAYVDPIYRTPPGSAPGGPADPTWSSGQFSATPGDPNHMWLGVTPGAYGAQTYASGTATPGQQPDLYPAAPKAAPQPAPAAPAGTVDRPSSYAPPTGFGSTYPNLPFAGGIPQNPTTTPGVFPAVNPLQGRVPTLTPPWRDRTQR